MGGSGIASAGRSLRQDGVWLMFVGIVGVRVLSGGRRRAVKGVRGGDEQMTSCWGMGWSHKLALFECAVLNQHAEGLLRTISNVAASAQYL